MMARAGRMLALAGVSAAVALTAGAAGASAAELECSTIQGAGSSLQNLAQTKVWAPEWKTAKSPECKNGATEVKYRASSTGKGKAQWGSETRELAYETPAEKEGTEKFPAFIGADVAPSATQQANMDEAGKSSEGVKNEIVAVPVEQSAISMVVTLPVGCEPSGTTSTATGTHLQEEWAKDAVSYEALLSGLTASTACAKVPSLEARSSKSGTSAGFKRFLGSIGTKDLKEAEKEPWLKLNASPEESESTNWGPESKVHTCCEKGSQLAAEVYEHAGDIGYADTADARAAKFTTAWVKHKVGTGSEEAWSTLVKVNSNGEAISPEASNGESNCSKAEYKEATNVAPNEIWSGARQTNTEKESSKAYPVCTLTFDLAWHRYSFPKFKYTATERGSVFEYLRWIVTKAQEGTLLEKLATEHYGKLPSATIEKDKTGVTETNIAF